MNINQLIKVEDKSVKLIDKDYVVIMVGSSSCSPCKMMKPVFQSCEIENEENYFYYDAEEIPSKLLFALGVLTLPHFSVVNKSGNHSFTGVFPIHKFKEKINELIN